MTETIAFPDPGLDLSDSFKPHTSHWGVFSARNSEAGLEVRAYAGDPDPNGIIDNFPGALRHQARRHFVSSISITESRVFRARIDIRPESLSGP